MQRKCSFTQNYYVKRDTLTPKSKEERCFSDIQPQQLVKSATPTPAHLKRHESKYPLRTPLQGNSGNLKDWKTLHKVSTLPRQNYEFFSREVCGKIQSGMFFLDSGNFLGGGGGNRVNHQFLPNRWKLTSQTTKQIVIKSLFKGTGWLFLVLVKSIALASSLSLNEIKLWHY